MIYKKCTIHSKSLMAAYLPFHNIGIIRFDLTLSAVYKVTDILKKRYDELYRVRSMYDKCQPMGNL